MWNPRAFRWCSQAALGQSQSTTLILQNAYNKLFILILIFLNTNGNSIQPGMLKINGKNFLMNISSLPLPFSKIGQDATHITAILGESVIFNCHVEFPGDHPVPYVLQWEKKVSETVC